MLDIVEHMPTLQKYAGMSDRVIEFGVRDGSGSTAAFLAGCPGELISYDISSCPHGLAERAVTLGVPFEFHQTNVLTVEVQECDLLFIDTVHTYEQLKAELEMHGNKATKWLIFHDTVTFGAKGEDGSTPGLMQAIDEFLEENHHWSVKEVFNNNNGLLVLEREDGVVLPNISAA